jgi:hypothetical protein
MIAPDATVEGASGDIRWNDGWAGSNERRHGEDKMDIRNLNTTIVSLQSGHGRTALMAGWRLA